MRIPAIRGVIDRRILVNYRVDPEVLAQLLPAPFRPQIVRGCGIAGICLIRLKDVRPRGLPSWLGITSENAAHRIAVEWDEKGQLRTGVYIPRRDTSLWLNTLAGGRIFPGVHHRARFQVREEADRFDIRLDSVDGGTHVAVSGRLAAELPPDSIFESVDEASEFFHRGSVGYSPGLRGCFDGLEMCTSSWSVTPADVEHVESSFFDDDSIFPPGSATFDGALHMTGIEHEWHSRGTLRVSGTCSIGAKASV